MIQKDFLDQFYKQLTSHVLKKKLGESKVTTAAIRNVLQTLLGTSNSLANSQKIFQKVNIQYKKIRGENFKKKQILSWVNTEIDNGSKYVETRS